MKCYVLGFAKVCTFLKGSTTVGELYVTDSACASFCLFHKNSDFLIYLDRKHNDCSFLEELKYL